MNFDKTANFVQTIPNLILKEISTFKQAEAILLTGSRAMGKAEKNSDWDFYVIAKNGTKERRRTWRAGGVLIETFCGDVKSIRKYFKEDARNGRGATIGMFVVGKVVKDDKGILKRLLDESWRIWSKGPSVATKKEKAFIDYCVANYIHDLEDCLDSKNEAFLLQNHAVNEFVRYYFRLAKRWLPRQKDRLRELKKIDSVFHSRVRKINTTLDWKRRMQETIKLGRYLGKRFSLRLNGELDE